MSSVGRFGRGRLRRGRAAPLLLPVVVYFWLAGAPVAVGVPASVTTGAEAATITLTAPLTPVTVPEGDDFFTQQTYHALNFDERRDFMWEETFHEPSISVGGGVWQGTFHATGGYVFPLFHGFAGALNAGRFGANYPIDTARYTLVAYRSRVSHRSGKAIYTSHVVDWPTGAGLVLAEGDGYYTPNQLVAPPPNGFTVSLHDLAGNPVWTSGPVYSLRFDPSLSGPAGTEVGYDWVRVVDPGSAPPLVIRWTTANVTPDPIHNPKVNVYVDAHCQGQDGDLLGRVDFNNTGAATGQFTLPTAALPPGRYCFRLALMDHRGGDAVLAVSQLSAALTIDGRPTLRFIDPSRTTGPDYATEVVGNPWDMDGPWDLDNLDNPLDQKAFVNEAFVDGVFTAVAVVVPPAPHSDAQVWLRTHPGRPIATSRYRWLTVQMALDPTLYGNISDKVMWGWGTRAGWWNGNMGADGSLTKFRLLYEGLNTVTIDLWDDGNLDPSDPNPSQIGWRALPTFANLRIDLAETTRPPGTNFYLVDVKLTATPEASSDGTFTIRFDTGDPEGHTAQVALYRDAGGSGFDGVLLDTVVVAPGTHAVTVSMVGFPGGLHWIYAVVTDAWGNAIRRYAEAPIHVVGPSCVGRLGHLEGSPMTRHASPKAGTPAYCTSR